MWFHAAFYNLLFLIFVNLRKILSLNFLCSTFPKKPNNQVNPVSLPFPLLTFSLIIHILLF